MPAAAPPPISAHTPQRPPTRRRTGQRAAIWVCIAAALLLVSCSSASPGAAAPSSTKGVTARVDGVPGTSWVHAAPASVGLDAAALDRSAHTAEVGMSQCLVVVRDGAIAGEWNFQGSDAVTTRNIFSVTKSITSILIGIAQKDGDLSLDDHASRWIPEWRGTPAAAVTVRDLLSMDSGREWSLAIDYGELLNAKDQTAFAVGLPQAHPPGKQWAYNNSAVQTLERVLQGATGRPVTEFAQQRLFSPLGMTHTRIGVDGAGNAQMFEGVHSTCEDLARFGLLLLHQGRWGAKQIVSSSYVAEATERSSSKLNVGYGYLFWLNHKGHIGNPLAATDLGALTNPKTTKEQLAPGAPSDLFWALGLGNQLVQVDPGSKTVVVRLGAGAPNRKPPTFGPAEASKIVTEAVQR